MLFLHKQTTKNSLHNNTLRTTMQMVKFLFKAKGNERLFRKRKKLLFPLHIFHWLFLLYL
mgnify:CR=1 FL=1